MNKKLAVLLLLCGLPMMASAAEPHVMASQQALNCRDQANVARVVAESLQTGHDYSWTYQKVEGMPFHRKGLLTLRSFVKMYFQANEPLYTYAKLHTPDQVWHEAFVGCMPTSTVQTVRNADGTYSAKVVPISPAEKQLIDEQTYIPGFK